MTLITAYSHSTARGPFWIVRKPDGWHLMWESEDLGTYSTPQRAADDAAGGTCTWPSFGNCGKVGLSDDISDWRPWGGR